VPPLDAGGTLSAKSGAAAVVRVRNTILTVAAVSRTLAHALPAAHLVCVAVIFVVIGVVIVLPRAASLMSAPLPPRRPFSALHIMRPRQSRVAVATTRAAAADADADAADAADADAAVPCGKR
jgi:hypothetical protein